MQNYRPAIGFAFSLAIVSAASAAMSYLPEFFSPPKNVADGTYYNACCSPVTIQNGVAHVGTRATLLRFTIMKFGLTAYPKSDIGIFHNYNKKYWEAVYPPLLFNDTKRPIAFSTVDYKNEKFRFVKK